ncbi:MAG TPA: hypothetical protein VMW10_07680 [Alphaproteobacteria bacterium]|nr:hypothetical protein [Alphaproteobacteria bacterium]
MLLRLLAGSALCISLQISSLLAMEEKEQAAVSVGFKGGPYLKGNSLSLEVAKIYAGTKSEEAKKAIAVFGNGEASLEEVAAAWDWKSLPPDVICCAPFMRQPASILKYREIIGEEKEGEVYSYHGYDEYSALIYDIQTSIGAVLRGENVEPRSRFRFSNMSAPYSSTRDFLSKISFYNDHDPRFTIHGISAVPHLFSNTAILAENCLTALQQQFVQTPDINPLVKALGFKEADQYIALGKKYLKGGYITRFTFSDLADFDAATYAAPNATETGTYGRPWFEFRESEAGLLQKQMASSSYFLNQLRSLSHEEEGHVEFLFNMQYRNIFIPSIYNDAARVQTKIFYKHDHDKLDEYYENLTGLVKEDLKDLSLSQVEQLTLWLK